LALIEALEPSSVKFKTEKLNWIGRMASITNVSVTAQGSLVKTVADAREREITIGALSANSPLTLLPKVMNATAGTKFKIIPGYRDSNAALLALERGEVEGTTVSWTTLKTAKADWLRDGKLNILAQYSLSPAPDLKQVPTAIKSALSADDKRLLSLFVSGADVGYSVFTSPGIPADRVAVLRAAFGRMTESQAFKEDARRLSIDLDPMPGEQLQAMIEKMNVFPDSVRARAQEIQRQK
jgi:tripartite-type tricarboxylate transporter receptor subunit TctC